MGADWSVRARNLRSNAHALVIFLDPDARMALEHGIALQKRSQRCTVGVSR